MELLKTVDGAALMSQPLQPIRFVVDTLIAQGLHILAGSPKVGKSWLALWLAVAVAKVRTPLQKCSLTADDGAWPPLEWCTHSAKMVHGGRGRGAAGRHA